MTNQANLCITDDGEHPGCCEECRDQLPRFPVENEGLLFCTDECLVLSLAKACQQHGCGAFLGSVEGGEVVS